MARRHRPRSSNGVVFFLFVFLLIAILCITILSKYRPLMKELAVNKAQYVATTAIHTSIQTEIAKNVLAYDKISVLEKDKEDKITAISTNMPLMNQLKTAATLATYEGLNSLEGADLNIPLGNLISGDYFSARGPTIPIKIMALGMASSRFESEFTAVGVNQTRHRITLHVQTDIRILFPLGNEEMSLSADFVVMETILLGAVPESYTYIDDTESTKLSKINDYGEREVD